MHLDLLQGPKWTAEGQIEFHLWHGEGEELDRQARGTVRQITANRILHDGVAVFDEGR